MDSNDFDKSSEVYGDRDVSDIKHHYLGAGFEGNLT